MLSGNWILCMSCAILEPTHVECDLGAYASRVRAWEPRHVARGLGSLLHIARALGSLPRHTRTWESYSTYGRVRTM